ncbi:MAG TPA: hypothetical protein VM452_13340 [Caulifigura sp.]|nr:hypothetical protein [Caulifigura sp.]
MPVSFGLDIVEELRLRRWARENYQSAENRAVDWHPVIHDEMERRDAEVALLDAPPILAARFYPNRRLDDVFGPHELRPHYELEAAISREMHYT